MSQQKDVTMRKIILTLFTLATLFGLSLTAFAVSEPEILREPQNLTWPANSVAGYSVEAYGENLSYQWYIVYEGKTYDTSKLSEGRQPWVDFVTEGAGPGQSGSEFYFTGILSGLNGAEIYCEVSNSYGKVKTSPAIISVGGSAMPPAISVVSRITVNKGESADIYCTASDAKGGELEYLWYETATGKLQDIAAVNRGAETADTLHCETDRVGTRYYVCMVTTPDGGVGYSSVVPVTVTEESAAHTHQFGEWMITTSPTCTEPGIQARECDCGVTERAEVPPTGHRWDEGTVTKEPTENTDGEKTFICTICKETKVETIKAAEAASGISGRSDNPAPVESETPDAAGTVQGERHSGFSWRAVVIIAVVLAGGAAAAAAIHIKRKKEKSN